MTRRAVQPIKVALARCKNAATRTEGSGKRLVNKPLTCAALALAFVATPAAAACKDSDLAGRWQVVINFPGVAPGGSAGFVLSCELRLSSNGQIRANRSTCVELSDGFDDPDATEEFAPGAGRLRVSGSCGVTGDWGANEIIGTLAADKATLIGAIEWSDGDIATFTAVRPGR